MANAKELAERARMFEERAEKATDPISRQHYREMAAHYRSLSVEHQDVVPLNRGTEAPRPILSIVGGSQLPAATPKYAKSTLLLGHAEHELSLRATMSAADDVRL